MGGGGGDHHHQPISRSMEAELWQGHPKEPEGWETTIYLTYGATAVLLTMALGFAPDTSIKTVSFIILYVFCIIVSCLPTPREIFCNFSSLTFPFSIYDHPIKNPYIRRVS
jgi:hypothetical protein